MVYRMKLTLDAIERLWRKAANTWTPPPKLTVSQWADSYRKLSAEASSEAGQWRTSRAPYQRGMLDVLNDPNYEEAVIMSSAQIGKTEIILNMIGYHVDQDPAPMLCLQPTLEMAQTFSKDRLATMIRDCPTLTSKVSDVGSKKGGNTLLKKDFAGGHCTLAGANSPASLASRPVRIVLCDEIDRYPASAGTEGDPVNLARKRTATFWNRKVILVSTPTDKGTSRIERAYEDSDKRRFNLPCPHCDELHHLQWSNVVFNKDDLEAGVHMVCPSCGGMYTEADKPKMLKLGEWIAQSPEHKRAGFHINELYSPWRKWSDVVTDFLEAKSSPETLKTWVNTSLGETFEEEGEKVDSHSLYMRREYYPKQVPNNVTVLTCGVDVQDDRLEATVYGFGGEHDAEIWAIEHRIFYGDPGRGELWQRLDDFLLSRFEHESGIGLAIASTCIDTGGHYTDAVYKFCKARFQRRVYPIKGSSVAGSPIVAKVSKTNKGGVKLFSIGTDTVKEIVYGRLNVAEVGAGYIHFPMTLDEEFFLQLTSEKRVTRYKSGHPYKVWVQTRPRNETLDCLVYALAGLEILRPNFKAIRERFETRIEKQTEAPPESTDALIQDTPQKARRVRKPRRSNSFVKGYQ